VWVSFAAAPVPAGTGLAWLPGTELDRAFMLIKTLRGACEASLTQRAAVRAVG
jgi:hypothetical protein